MLWIYPKAFLLFKMNKCCAWTNIGVERNELSGESATVYLPASGVEFAIGIIRLNCSNLVGHFSRNKYLCVV